MDLRREIKPDEELRHKAERAVRRVFEISGKQ